MCILKRTKRQQVKQALDTIRRFAEGKISTTTFWKTCKENASIQYILTKDRKRKKHEFIVGLDRESILPINADNMLEKVDIDKLSDRGALYVIVKRYFMWRRTNIKFYNEDENLLVRLESLLPKWVNCVDIDYLKQVLDFCPHNLSATQRVNWEKNKVKDLFQYKTVPPSWLQDAQWPIVEGIPYVFDHQETAPEGYEKYYFYDPNDETKQLTIEQCE